MNDEKKNSTILKGILAFCVFMAMLLALATGIYSWRETQMFSEENGKLESENVRLNEEIARLTEENTALKGNIKSLKKKVKKEKQKAENAVKQLNTQKAASVSAQLSPGDILENTEILSDVGSFFTAEDIVENGEIYNRIYGKSYRDNENVKLSDLKYLRVLHYNFDHQIQVGEIIVNAGLAQDVLNIFRELFEQQYEIQSMYLIDNYWTGDGDTTDNASIEVNNTSSFNYRQVTGGGNLSNHAYGCAIDINPQQNPYVWNNNGQLQWSHANADPYIDRTSGDPHVIVAGDICYRIFEKYGFSWGGNWSDPIDYQHFEKKLSP